MEGAIPYISRYFHKGAHFLIGKNRISKQFVLRKIKRYWDVIQSKNYKHGKRKMTRTKIGNILLKDIFTSLSLSSKSGGGGGLAPWFRLWYQMKLHIKIILTVYHRNKYILQCIIDLSVCHLIQCYKSIVFSSKVYLMKE